DDHLLEFEGEALLHLLVDDVRRWCVAALAAGEHEELRRCLEVMAHGILSDDDYVQNAVAVSFVEDTPTWDASMASFMAVWPAALQAEAARQQSWGDPDA
ncbi:MAG: hypothetical protein ABMA25_18430, partial [Ilumatobacteraceae bacterium]